MAFKLAALLALAFVVAVSADYDWSDWSPPAQDGLYTDDQFAEITIRINNCVNNIGFLKGSMEQPGQICRTKAEWKILEEPITKEDLIPFMRKCLEQYRNRGGIKSAKIDEANRCLEDELSQPLITPVPVGNGQ